MFELRDVFAPYGKGVHIFVGVACAVLWAVVAFEIQMWTLFFLDGFYPGYEEPKAYNNKSANAVGGWLFISIPVLFGLVLGWWLRKYVVYVWVIICASGQVVLSMNYILWYDEYYWHPGKIGLW